MTEMSFKQAEMRRDVARRNVLRGKAATAESEQKARFDAMSDEEIAHHFSEHGAAGMLKRQINRATKVLHALGEQRRESLLYYPDAKLHPHRYQSLDIENIEMSPHRRPLDENTVTNLMASIERGGLQSPPAVRIVDKMMINGEEVLGVPVLVYGHHRLEAMKRLGREWISCLVLKLDDVQAELTEISENLHRAELTVLQHAKQVARWIELTESKRASDEQDKPAQVAPVSKGGRGKESGINAAARELGIERTAAQRDVKIASLSPEADLAAVETGLDDNQSALLEAAKEVEPEKQVAVLKERFEAGAAKAAAASVRALDKLRNRKVEAKPDPVDESDDPETDEDGYYLKDEPVDQWRRSVMNMAGESVSLPAFWTRELRGWRKFEATPEMVQLAREAATMWGSLAVDLADRLANADQQQTA